MTSDLVTDAAGHVRNIMTRSIKRQAGEAVLVVYDRQSGLSSIMADAYRQAIPDGEFIDFDQMKPEEILAKIDSLKPGDIVALVQSTSFRLNEFRLRIELFNRKLKTVEHMHLNRMPEEQWETWIDALAFDPSLDGKHAREIKAVLDQAKTVEIQHGDLKLTWSAGMEPCKLNIGDYAGMEHIGGTYPIGEVFTESRDLTQLNGDVQIYAFAGDDFLVRFFEPFTATVKDGMIEPGADAPPEFVELIQKIKDNERAIVREFGVGLNKAITRAKPLSDITAFERTYGLHLSLGEKHGVYKKPGFQQQKTRFHVDVFPVFDRVVVDGKALDI